MSRKLMAKKSEDDVHCRTTDETELETVEQICNHYIKHHRKRADEEMGFSVREKIFDV